MRFFFTVLSLICFVLAHQLCAKPVDDRSNLSKTRLGLSNINCVMHCVQPVGQESDEVPIATQSLMSNYGTLYDCLQKCSQV